MQKQLSKKSHKQTETSVDDFLKHIRKYNLQSERYISPKPLLYMYTNPSRNFTLQTLEKSRSKSKTLSNRQNSNSKKSNSKNFRQKVQKMLSITKKQNIHKKSLSLISNKNEKSIKKLKQPAQIQSTKSKQKIKPKMNQFKLKPMTTSNKKVRKSKSKFDDSAMKIRQSSHVASSIPEGEIVSQMETSQLNKDNPAQLIQTYSKKLFKVQLFLEANKNKLGSMLCRKFQQILNQIVQSLVKNLKKSLNQLQTDVEKRLTKKFNTQFDKAMKEKQQEIKSMEKICQKITKKFSDMLHKQHYSNSLIYNLRLRGIDIDNQFGRAVWNVDNLTGLGYRKSQTQSQNQQEQNLSTHRNNTKHKDERGRILKTLNDESESEEFQFREHPRVKQKRQTQYKHKFRQGRTDLNAQTQEHQQSQIYFVECQNQIKIQQQNQELQRNLLLSINRLKKSL